MPVKQDELIALIAERAEVSRRHADEILLATLGALAERLTADETHDLLAQLPKRYKQRIHATATPTELTVDEFVGRVAELEGDRSPDADEARVHVRAALSALSEAVNAGEMRDVLDQLGAGFAPLLGGAPDDADAGPDDARDAFETLEREVGETFDEMRDRVDETFAAAAAEDEQPAGDSPVEAATALGRELVSDVVHGAATAGDAVRSAVVTVLDVVIIALEGAANALDHALDDRRN